MSDIRLAFAHPEERSINSSLADPRDRISLRDHIVQVDIGAFQQERGHKQRVMFNVVVEVRSITAQINDDVDLILSYDRLVEAIEIELGRERLNLLETLAERIAERILTAPQAMRAFIRIEKLDLGPYKLGVEIVRSRAEAALKIVDAQGVETALHPHIVFIDNATLRADDLAARMDALAQTHAAPLIFALGMPDVDLVCTQHRPTQRRVDLLAIEQNAWAFAARYPQCKVVATRTEIDWAIKHGQSIIWAPSKMVLDAVDGPKTTDPIALALWLGEEVAATGLSIHGQAPAFSGSCIPIIQL